MSFGSWESVISSLISQSIIPAFHPFMHIDVVHSVDADLEITVELFGAAVLGVK